MSIVVAKLGSAIVSDHAGTVRGDVLDRVCEQVATQRARGRQIVIVTSGAISIGMRAMELPVRPSAMDELQAASAVGQGRLYREYAERLSAHGLRSAQVLLTFFDMSARTHYLNARQTLRRLLAWDVVPVINENDTTTTDEISFGDNDFLAAQVAILLQADELLLFTDTDGLYTRDPRRDPHAALLTEVSDFETLEKLEIGVSSSPIGSGGMRSKVVAAEMATAAGIYARIANGRKPDVVAAAFAGEDAGTRFLPQQGRVSSFKLWLKYAKPTQGRLVVDDGAAAALRERNSSLLPVGITSVEGEFEPGDAVEVTANTPSRGTGGRPIGKGIVNYSAAELRRVIGLKTAEVRELLPRAADEAVHRDYFVLD
jgi:glutamate 5-kinase